MSDDALLLLAILYSEKETPQGASLSAIISTADYLNHAIMTYAELNEGVAHLQALGCIEEERGHYRATADARAAYLKFTKPRRSAGKDLEDVRRYLAARDGDTSGVPSLNRPVVSSAGYEGAVAAYLQRMNSITSKPRRKSKTPL